MANLGFSYTGVEYVDVHPHIKYVGQRNRPDDYQDDVDEENRRNNLGGYLLVNLSFVSKNVPGPFTFRLAAQNLLDKEYFTVGGKSYHFDIRRPGRRILFSADVKF